MFSVLQQFGNFGLVAPQSLTMMAVYGMGHASSSLEAIMVSVQ